MHLKKIIDFLWGKERGKKEERERQRERHWFVVPLIYAFISWFLYVPWWDINPQPWHGWTVLLPTQLAGQGHIRTCFKSVFACISLKVSVFMLKLYLLNVCVQYCFPHILTVDIFTKSYFLFFFRLFNIFWSNHLPSPLTLVGEYSVWEYQEYFYELCQLHFVVQKLYTSYLKAFGNSWCIFFQDDAKSFI